MAIASIKDVVSACNDGRWHLQRFYKVAGLAGDNLWQDWAYSSGQPGTNARIGDYAAFTPAIASKNQAVWFPGIDAGQDRHLAQVTIASIAGGTNQATCSFVIYDLLGVYPLLDGDSIDEQLMDNSLTLPRYTDGKGVMPVLVNHIAAQVTTGTGTYTYTSCDGSSRTVTFGIANVGLNKAAATASTASLATTGTLFMPLGNGCGGVRKVDGLTFTSAPSGLFALYLIKPLMTITNNDGNLTTDKIATEKCNLMFNALNMPKIYDGAHLGIFYMASGGGRTVALDGHMTFVWG